MTVAGLGCETDSGREASPARKRDGRRRKLPSAKDSRREPEQQRRNEQEQFGEELAPKLATIEMPPRRGRLDVVIGEGLPLGFGDLAEMDDAPSGQRMGGVELDERGPRVIGIEQHGLGRTARICHTVLSASRPV